MNSLKINQNLIDQQIIKPELGDSKKTETERSFEFFKISETNPENQNKQLESKVKDITSEFNEIKTKCGHLWECISRESNPIGMGYFYTFKLKDEFSKKNPQYKSAIEKINNDIFPAIEIPGHELQFLNPEIKSKEFFNTTIDELVESHLEDIIKSRRSNDYFDSSIEAENLFKKNAREIIKSQIEKSFKNIQLQSLGYKIYYQNEEMYLILPDKEALKSCWDQLREKKPELPPLDVVSSEGVATDSDFVKAYMEHDALLSNGKEFVHDHLVHVLSILNDMLNKSNEFSYLDQKQKIVNCINNIYQKILNEENNRSNETPKQIIEALKMALGALVDSISSLSLEFMDVYRIDHVFQNLITNIWNNEESQSYAQKRFPNINQEKLLKTWTIIKSR